MELEQVATCRSGRFSSFERLAAIGLSLVAVVSPLYIDRRQSVEMELDLQPTGMSSYLLLVLIMAVGLSIFRRGRFSSYERLVAIGLALVAVVSPLYIDRRQSVDIELDAQPTGISSYLLLVLLFVLIISLSISKSGCRFSSNERLVAIVLALFAVVSPLYIDRRQTVETELYVQPTNNIYSYLPLLLLVLIMAITLTSYLDRSFSRFDPYWIHRAGGSSYGIIIALMVLALILKCKTSAN